MNLKALEIQGFKSFPDKTVLTFDSDITAIVGPNGSGKSNISDAITWALGEQSSRALRGSKMEDVIFSGTPRRRQAGFAEVSLILDNLDAEADGAAERMVTRRYYRSGEGEYYINRQSARLRDVNELFMDTGLGRDGYASIGQGRIDEILSVRSEDRREIFEEAAGISRCRHRREETERRLARAEENLVRIRDRIAELELQVGPLQEQAEKAKSWLLCRDELRALELAVWLDALQTLQTQEEARSLARETAQQELTETRTALDELYARAETLSADMRERDRQAERLREQISLAEADRQKNEADAAVLRTRFENNAGNMERIRRELAEQHARSGGLEDQIAEQQARIAALQAQRQARQADLEQARQAGQALEERAGECTAAQLDLQQARADTAAQLAENRAALGAASASVQELMDRQTSAERDRADLRSRLSEAQAQSLQQAGDLSAAEEAAASARNAAAGQQLLLKTRTQKRDVQQQQQQDLDVELRTLASRVKLFQDMERSYEGFSGAVKTVMQESGRGTLRGIHGPVSRLLKTEQAYALAVETALGSSMQSIVVSSEEDGKAAIALLRRRGAGRATFLPLSVIRGRPLQERGLADCAGFAGIASDLIETDSAYREIFLNLLGRTVIAEDMDAAIAMARRFGHRFRIVTLDGQVLNAGGSMTGGSAVRTAGVITRASELEHLLALQTDLQAQKRQAEKQLSEAQRAVSEAEYGLAAARDALRQQEDSVLQQQGEARRLESLTASLTASIQNFDADLASVQTRIDAGRERIDALRPAIAQLQQQQEEQAGRLQALQQEQEALSGQISGASERMTAIRLDLAALEAEEQTAAGSAAQLASLAGTLQGDRTQKEQMLAACEQDSARLQTEIGNLEAGAGALTQKAAELRQELRAVLDDRMQLEGQKTACEADARSMNQTLLQQERECARLEQQETAAGLEEKQILDRMWENYELTPSGAREAAAQVESIPEARRQIASLKQKLSALGSPSIGAIEEYARVSERYEYLKTQEADAEQASREITDLIRSLTAEMTEIFRTEFEKINENFRQTFTELFGGGTASLELEDPQNVLTCGIEIHVQPPGKQLRTLSLLSGGEKALVAIALYFAILKVRPAPFCVLDEIDAALDDQNVGRFVRYLRSLSGQTRFLVITHRRGTMEGADVLYGVTMQEQGVSRVVRMDLDRIAREMHLQ